MSECDKKRKDALPPSTDNKKPANVKPKVKTGISAEALSNKDGDSLPPVERNCSESCIGAAGELQQQHVQQQNQQKQLHERKQKQQQQQSHSEQNEQHNQPQSQDVLPQQQPQRVHQQQYMQQQQHMQHQQYNQQQHFKQQQPRMPWQGATNEYNWNSNFNGNNNGSRPYNNFCGPQDFRPNAHKWFLNNNNCNRPNYPGNFGNNNYNKNNFAGSNNNNNWDNNSYAPHIENTAPISRNSRKKERKRYARFLRRQEGTLNQDNYNTNEFQASANDLRNSTPATAQRSENNQAHPENSYKDRNRECREQCEQRDYRENRVYTRSRARSTEPEAPNLEIYHNEKQNCQQTFVAPRELGKNSTVTSSSTIRQTPSSTVVSKTATNKPTFNIQIRPLAQLLKQEILAVTQEDRLAKQPKASTEINSKTAFRPRIQSRRSTISYSCSNNGSQLNLNERLAHMDKEGLKYIINNSDTIYDEPLKLQARKRLREEIRRQLKNIELEQPKNQKAAELIEDDIVEAIKLPEFLLQEIQTAFCLDLGVRPEIAKNKTSLGRQINQEVEKSNTNLGIQINPEVEANNTNSLDIQIKQEAEEIDTNIELESRRQEIEHIKSKALRSKQIIEENNKNLGRQINQVIEKNNTNLDIPINPEVEENNTTYLGKEINQEVAESNTNVGIHINPEIEANNTNNLDIQIKQEAEEIDTNIELEVRQEIEHINSKALRSKQIIEENNKNLGRQINQVVEKNNTNLDILTNPEVEEYNTTNLGKEINQEGAENNTNLGIQINPEVEANNTIDIQINQEAEEIDTNIELEVKQEIEESISNKNLRSKQVIEEHNYNIGVRAEQETEKNKTSKESSEAKETEHSEKTMPGVVRTATDLMSRIKVAEELKATARKRKTSVETSSEQSNTLVKKATQQQPPAKRVNKEAAPSVCPKDSSSAPAALTAKPVSVDSMPLNVVIKQEQPCRPVTASDMIPVVVLSSDDENESSDESAVQSDKVDDAYESAKRRTMQQLKIDADNVVNSFKQQILPHLDTELAASYRRSHSRNTNSRLNFIATVVTSPQYNSKQFDQAEKNKIEQNLKQVNNRIGLDFLLREIPNVVQFLKQPAPRKRQRELSITDEITAEPLVTNDKDAEPAAAVPTEAATHQTTVEKTAEVAAAPAKSPSAPNTPANTPPSSEAQCGSLSPYATSITTAYQRSLPMLPYAMNLDTTLSHISPGNYPVPGNIDFSDSRCQDNFNDTVARNLMEIDRRVLENHNRRSFLEEMILKFQKEKSDLEILGMELQNRKFLLLNTAFQRNQMTHGIFLPPPIGVQTPTNTPPPAAPQATSQAAASVGTTAKLSAPLKRRQLSRRTVVVKRVRVAPQQKVRPKRRNTVAAPEKVQHVEMHAKETDSNAVPKDVGNKINMPMPMLVPQIKEEPIEANEPVAELNSSSAASKPAPSSADLNTTKPVAQRVRLIRTKSISSLTTSQPLARIPPLPPPPAPPESIAFDLPRILLKSPKCSSSADYNTKSTASGTKQHYNTRHLSSGRFNNIRSPITQLRIYESHIIAAAEDGDIYMFNIQSHRLEYQITKHSEAITNMYLCERSSVLYTTSLDGFLKKSALENLERVLQTVYFKEPLQSIDVAWDTAYIGSRWGSIFTFNILTNKILDMSFVTTGHSIIAIKAHQEGDRKVIILGCKGSLIYIHDALTGIKLRDLSLPEGLNVYSMLLNDGLLFCGTQKNEIFKFNFTTGQLISTMHCGNGAVSMSCYKDKYLLAGCYDGFIYVLDKVKCKQLGRFEGAGRLVLAMTISDDKIITSSKDNSLEVLDMPMQLFQNSAAAK